MTRPRPRPRPSLATGFTPKWRIVRLRCTAALSLCLRCCCVRSAATWWRISPLFAAPQPVNRSFSRLAGASAVGSKRLGSVTFAEMERLEKLFRSQLEATSSSLWMMSGILAMLKRNGFNPSTPGLFNTAISSVSVSAFPGAFGGFGISFLRSKRRESLLSHSNVLIPEPQKRALVVTPGSDSGLFNESLLDSVAAQVKEDSLVSSSLAVSKALSSRSGSEPVSSASTPLAGPSILGLLVRHSGRGSALRRRLTPATASTSRGVRDRLLLGNLWVFASRSHCLSSPCPTAACPSTGRSGGTVAWIRGWWRSFGRGIAYPSFGLLPCLRSPSPCLRMPLLPPKGLRSRRSPLL